MSLQHQRLNLIIEECKSLIAIAFKDLDADLPFKIYSIPYKVVEVLLFSTVKVMGLIFHLLLSFVVLTISSRNLDEFSTVFIF